MSSGSSANEVLIVGAGISGLVAAIALGRLGKRVRVFEQAPEIAPIGYGIQLGPNTISAFKKIGIADKILEKAFLPENLVMREASGEVLARVPLGDEDFFSRFDGRYMALHRGDIHDILKAEAASVPGAVMQIDTQIASFEDTGTEVVLRSGDGREFRGAAVLAADGLRSLFRAQLVGDELVPIRYNAHRTIVKMADMPAEVSRDNVVLWLGPAWHIIHYPLNNRQELNVVAVFRDDLCSSDPDPAVRKRALMAALDKVDPRPELRAVLDGMNLERNWPISDRTPARKWAKGRVALIGDAAHASLQSLAQGAGMAIEDGVALAGCVAASSDNYEQAFQTFTRERVVRTSRVILESRAMWPMYHEIDETSWDVRRQQYQEKSTEDLHRCLEWVWKPQFS